MLRTIFTLIISLFLMPMSAQIGKLFDTDNQLSSNFANQVLQDKRGFIWIATRNGLNRYDGYNFTVMNSTDKNGHNINNYVNCMGQDHEGNIYLGTNNNLFIYDGYEFRKIPMLVNGKEITTYIQYIYTRNNGDVLVCTSGFGLLRVIDKNKAESIGGVIDQYKYINFTFEDHNDRLWMVCSDGDVLRQETSGKVTIHVPGTAGLQIREIAEDRQGNIYVATLRQGLFVMAPQTDRFTHVAGTAGLAINNIYIARNDNIYIGCNGEGLYVYEPATGKLTNNPFFCNRINLSKTKVTSIIEDAEGNIWMSMLQKGVFMQPTRPYEFGYMGFRLGSRNMIGENSVTSVLRSEDGSVWVGTDKDGLYRLHFGTSMPISSTHVVKQPLAILSLCEDLHGNIWVGNYEDGCGYVDPSGNYHNIDLPLGKNSSVFDIKADRNGNIWIATMGNGLICRRTDGSLKIFRQLPKAYSDRHINSIPNDYIMKLALSPDHKYIYVATSVGLACMDIATNNWVSKFSTNCVNYGSFSHCVFADSRGNVWYGTENGVYCYSNGSTEAKLYNTDNGLPDNSIAFVTEDARGDIWIGTIHGLCRLHVKTGKTNNYFLESGLQSNEFSDGAVFAADGGRLLLLGGTGGLNWFDPLKLKLHSWKANVCVSRLIVGNRTVYPGMESGSYTITEERVFYSKKFDLAHDDNSFTLQFSALTYNNTEQIAYAYSINGEDWHFMQPGINEVTFSHLPAGTYNFRVKAINNQQETPIREFTVEIHPAWYASVLARFIYFIIAMLLLWTYMKHRRKLEQDRMLLQNHIHAEEMGEAKLRFFMNISHEIRTPLTLIITPLLSLIKDDKDTQRQGIYEIIRKNSERILHLINQMMDLRKIDKGQMTMHMSQTDLVAFINDEYKLFLQQATNKNITFEFEHDSETLPVWIDRNNFDKVIMNVLSNAFKFTPTGGHIIIRLTHTEHHAYISVKDNGIGIPKDKIETIFQRFYQSPTNPNDRNIGTGIGLDLTRSLVELHYGTIVARNNEESEGSDFTHGSEFTIRIPLGNAHLKPEEMVNEEDIKDEPTLLQEMELENNRAMAMETNTQTEAEELTNNAKGGKATLAIVEDEDDIRKFLCTQFADDFKVLTYHNGKEALLEIVKLQPDLIISDVMMPEMDGMTLCSKIKANVNTNHIPVILLTAKSREEDQLEGLETGADAYILKPFNMDILRRIVINLLTTRRTLRNKFNGNESQESRIEEVTVQTPDEALMERIMQVINENLSDSDLSVDIIAQKVGISRVHLHRKMKDLTNQTPHSFVRNIRLKQAAKMLRTSKRNITEVMYLCGFSNAASFSTMFKNLYGCSPREYMNNGNEQ